MERQRDKVYKALDLVDLRLVALKVRRFEIVEILKR
jgi:hypothetical protein